ncbi:MAG: enoyl-CoA hydratase/isomerase family protein, partial [Proteobacteria bacterium]|nr:enoyl-CoA hydratase/isomerase family protein [Pseudomonadota bacterium]
TVAQSRRFANLTGKTAIVVQDAPGFAVNRFFVPWLNEAVRLLDEGVADIPTIDAAAKKAFRIGMGPFLLMNVTGVPIAYHSTGTLGDELGPFYASAPGLEAQFEKGQNWPVDGEADEAKFQAVADRLQGVVFLVAGQILDEGVASMTDVDIGAKVGLRWARGPFEMMNLLGIDRVYGLVKPIVDGWDDLAMPASIQAQRDAGQNWDIRYVTREDHGGVAYLTLNRPEAMNALNETVVGQLAEVFDAADADPSVKSIVIAGAGKAFIAGADIGYFIKNIKNNQIDKTVAFTAYGQELLKRIDNSPKLVIARMDGLALGGGAEIALCADTIVATPQATMGFPETGIGIYPGLGGTQRTARYVGPELAKYLVFTGRVLGAEDARRIGLVEYVVDPGELDGFIQELAASGKAVTKASRGPVELGGDWLKIKDWFGAKNVGAMIDGSARNDPDPLKAKTAKTIVYKAPLAVRLANRIIDEGYPLPLEEGLQKELDHLEEIFSTEDALEGLTSLGRKRPEYKGK